MNRAMIVQVNEKVAAAPSPTIENVSGIREFWHRTAMDYQGLPVRCRANGQVKTWKTRPNEFRLPVKHGLRNCFYITHANIGDWVAAQSIQEET